MSIHIVIFHWIWEYLSVESIIIIIGIMCYEVLQGLKRKQFEVFAPTERASAEGTETSEKQSINTSTMPQ